MKITAQTLKWMAAATLLSLGTSCTTTYDAYGRPVQSVDPGLAVAGIAAAGLVGYAIAENNHDDRPPPPAYREPYVRPYVTPQYHHRYYAPPPPVYAPPPPRPYYREYYR